ncbi:MAG: inorganic phosphate transporter [candidate division FCPU426 bacterium]
MTGGLGLILFAIFVALVFDFINGFHDAANSIATVVSTRVLTPGAAVAWAAFFNFVAAFIFGTHVAKAIGSGMVDAAAVTTQVVLSGLAGAIAWNLFTWFFGLPSSSSHALIGGFCGAALMHSGPSALLWSTGKLQKTILFIFLAPLIGMILGLTLMIGVLWLFRRWHPSKIDRFFRRGQLFSAALYSLGHGGNDAQKTMGIIVALLSAAKMDAWAFVPGTHEISWWIILPCHAAIALGTMSGGWRIVKTMGQKITKLKPIGGFCAETAGSITLFGATAMGVPVSTTHTITGAITGVGSTQRLNAVKWGVAENIVWAWILTIPAAGGIAALCQLAFDKLG